MNLEKVNRDIAIYMGTTYFTPKERDELFDGFLDPYEEMIDYTKSIDSLILVWEKLDVSRFMGHPNCLCPGQDYATKKFSIGISDLNCGGAGYSKTTIQEAAAFATVERIRELE